MADATTETPSCLIRSLPPELTLAAARVASDIFPANRPAVAQFATLVPGDASDAVTTPQFIAALTTNAIWVDLARTYTNRYDKQTDDKDYGPVARPSHHHPRERVPMGDLTILHGVRTVQLTQGYNALVDEADYASVASIPWNPLKSRNIRYAFRGKKGDHLLMHKVIMGAGKGTYCDHRNSDGLDNRRSNLRLCSSSQNAQNRRVILGASRFKGVTRRSEAHKAKPWQARIRIPGGRRLDLGRFATEAEAALAYDAKARELFGEFACTNEDIYGEVT